MCARFTLRTHPAQWVRILGAVMPMAPFDTPLPIVPRYNIAPTQTVFAFFADEEQTATPAFLRWGLLPPWADALSVGGRLINARCETVSEKPAFRAAFRHRRCVIAADGYYEWVTQADGKQPFLIECENVEPFFMAGLWERNEKLAGPGESLLTCTLITTTASVVIQSIHDRMPVLLDAQRAGQWLTEAEPSLLRPAEDFALRVRPVSRRVNSVRNDDPQCIDSSPRQRELF